MRRRYYKRTALLISGLLALFAAALLWSTGREIQQQQLNRALIAAVRNVDAQTVLEMLDRGADPDTCETPQEVNSLWTLLRARLQGRTIRPTAGTPALILGVIKTPSPYADKAGYIRGVTIVKALLERGARVDGKNEEGVDLMNLTVESAYDLQILRLLIQHRGNIDHHSLKHHSLLLEGKNPLNGRTPLMTAAGWGEPEMVNLLLDAGANVNTQADRKWTALMYAVDKGRSENITCLLAHHANMHLRDSTGNTALSLAQASRRIKKVTPFSHEAGADFWSHIITMLKQADAR